MTEFFGGDLQGIRDHLDYLQELGVSALYLNPIFTSMSNHRYDVIDYFHVDPHLGGDQALVELRAELDRRGMSLILDIVPNHCGVLHPWFQEAQANPQAASSEYFTFQRHPDEYACWLGVKSLPKLNYRSAALREIMYTGNQSIFRHWLRPPYSIDGWRLDVANMLGRQGPDQLGLEVGRGIRQAVKEENPQDYLMGENFFDASNQLQGDCWDAVMNYWGFAKPLHYWLTGFQVHQHAQPHTLTSSVPWMAQDLAESWQNARAAIPWQIARQQFNLLGSHDTPRILTQLNGDRSMACLAAAVLMTYVGVSSIYYGDEIGQGATPGATSRDSMPWDRQEWDLEMLDFYQRLIHLRRTSPALIDGGFQVLLAEGDTLAYLRDHPQELLIVVAQRHSSTRPAGGLPVAHGAIPDGVEFTELFSGQRATVSNGHLPLPSLSPGVQIWVSKD
jgi:alpha-glucosidase